MFTSGDWKLIVYPEANHVRPYDVRRNLEELVDLSDVAEHLAIA